MSVFGDYSRYYDLLYRDKDYSSEVEFVLSLLDQYSPRCKTILDLGVGSGRHAVGFAEKGFQVHGVDLSSAMLEQAKELVQKLPPPIARKLAFSQGDARKVRLKQKFDTVVSLFHVFSYQTSQADLQAMLTTVREHLKDGGHFIFDCWYGPAVYASPPQNRIKRLEDESTLVTRICEPDWKPNENRVDVHYEVIIEDKETHQVKRIHETHSMRYLFFPEIQSLLEETGFSLVESGEWMTGAPLSSSVFSACFVARLTEN